MHSYYCVPVDPAHTVAQTDFGIRYASVVRRGSVWGIQCHPEKSQAVGLRILRNFVRMVSVGVWGCGGVGVWGCGSMGVWEYGSAGA